MAGLLRYLWVLVLTAPCG